MHRDKREREKITGVFKTTKKYVYIAVFPSAQRGRVSGEEARRRSYLGYTSPDLNCIGEFIRTVKKC